MNLSQAIDFIWTNARPLDRAIFEVHFCGGSPGRIIDILRTYQNPDGGFGHALEPDVRAPDSQPLFIEFALATLRDHNLRDAQMTLRALDFLARHADFERGIPPVFPSFQRYPHAAHWDNPAYCAPSLNRLTGIVGLARWQGVPHPWLDQAVDVCLAQVAGLPHDDAHTLLPAFTLLEAVSGQRDVEPLFHKLASQLPRARFFSLEAPVKGYALTPLHLAPHPAAYASRLFSAAQIEAHLADLASQQAADGGWPIQWDPPGPAALWEWRAQRTVSALVTLKAYNRLP